MESVYSALDRNLTLGANVSASVTKINFTTRIGYGVTPWLANQTYTVGVVVSYGGAVYTCLTANTDAAWTVGKWTLQTTAGVNKLDNWEIQTVTNPMKFRPQSVLVGQVIEKDKFKTITDPVSLHWDFLDGSIRVKYITGLEASKKYEISLLIF